PEERGGIGPVEERRGVAFAALAADADGAGLWAGEAVGRVVAAGAGDGAVAGQDGVEEQLPAEPYLAFGKRVVVRDGPLLVQAGRDELERQPGRQRVFRQWGRWFGAREREEPETDEREANPTETPHGGSSRHTQAPGTTNGCHRTEATAGMHGI